MVPPYLGPALGVGVAATCGTAVGAGGVGGAHGRGHGLRNRGIGRLHGCRRIGGGGCGLLLLLGSRGLLLLSGGRGLFSPATGDANHQRDDAGRKQQRPQRQSAQG